MYPFAEGCFAVRNAWYIAAFSHEVTRNPMERWFLDEPVVMYRKTNGEAVALAGRCPHRQYPMAAGKLDEDVLTCGYHGIAFGADGSCVHIPNQTDIPSAFSLRTFPFVERWKWLWIWMGDPELADESLIPDHDAIGLLSQVGPEGEMSLPLFHYDVHGRYQLLNDNLLDLSHLAYLHGDNFGIEALAEITDEVTSGDGWVRSARRVEHAEAAPWTVDRDDVSHVDYTVDFTFLLPALHVGVSNLAVSRRSPHRPGEMLQEAVIYHAITPARRQSAHYFFAITVKRPSPTTRDIIRFENSVATIIAQDIFATEQIERMLAGNEKVRDLTTANDEGCVKARQMLEKMMKAEGKPKERKLYVARHGGGALS